MAFEDSDLYKRLQKHPRAPDASECPTHGWKYIHDPRSTLCFHPVCVGKVCTHLRKKSPSIEKWFAYLPKGKESLDLLTDEVLLALIKKMTKEPDFYAFINQTAVYFACLRVVTNQANKFKKKNKIAAAVKSVYYDVREAGMSSVPSPTSELFCKEILEHVAENYGMAYALFFVGEISRVDLMKLEKMTPRQLKEKLEEIKKGMIGWL